MRVPWNKGKNLTEEHKRKLSLAKQGRRLPDVVKRKISEAHKRIHHIGQFKKGQPAWNKGLKTGIVPKTAFKKGQPPWNAVHKEKYICQNPDCGTAFFDVPSTKRQFCSIKCKSLAMPIPKGAGNGKGSYCLKGHWVRSTWERMIADWLFEHNIEYQYEPQRFLLGQRTYVPDFYFPKFNLWMEVKGFWSEDARTKIGLFRKIHPNLIIVDKTNFGNFGEEMLDKMYLNQTKIR